MLWDRLVNAAIVVIVVSAASDSPRESRHDLDSVHRGRDGTV
jgi:hypothetical protein